MQEVADQVCSPCVASPNTASCLYGFRTSEKSGEDLCIVVLTVMTTDLTGTGYLGLPDPLFYLQLMRECYSKPEAKWTPFTQADFKNGTVRITTSGCYYLAEDIEFSPNSKCCDYWPRLNDPPHYTAADGSRLPLYPTGPYSLGFFAAITIEADNVVLDLNGKTLSASLPMSLKQRFMNIIQVSSRVFESHDGMPSLNIQVNACGMKDALLQPY